MDSNHRHQIRSYSLPSELNPFSKRIEEKLKKLRIKEEKSTSSSETIRTGLSGVAELYECINQVMGLPLTQKALSLHQREKCVGELLKECSRLLNVCSAIREMALQQKEMAERLALSLSQRKENSSSLESHIAGYDSSRKEVIRRAKGVILSLKHFNDATFTFDSSKEEEYHLSTVIKSLRCVSIINVSVYESLLFFMSIPVANPKRSLVSKLMNKGRSKRDDQSKINNELNHVDIAIHTLFSKDTIDDMKSHMVQKRLKDLLGVMEGIENGLASLCKHLIQAKACLMEILSF